MNQIDFRTDHRLSDTLALQAFILRHHLLRRALLLAVCMLGGLAVATLMNGAPLADSLSDLARNAGFYVVLFVVGLVLIQLIAFAMGTLVWLRRPKPREIRGTITPDGITLQKDGFSYSARWRDANFAMQSRTAYMMKFRNLYIRLPKRGFSPEADVAFRDLLGAGVPVAVNRLNNS